MGPRVVFFLGGARSGKSRLAQERAESMSGDCVYLATGQAFDAEMRARIDRHRADRGPGWRTVECPVALPAAVVREAGEGRVLLIDCLTLWVSNLLLDGADMEAAGAELVAALAGAGGPVILVSNEVGLGIVPDNALARAFRDAAGRLHQRVAAVADEVVFVAAGLGLRMK